jgi:hypothetical protein
MKSTFIFIDAQGWLNIRAFVTAICGAVLVVKAYNDFWIIIGVLNLWVSVIILLPDTKR